MKIHQALLGYERGHRILSASIELHGAAKHDLLQFSDRAVDTSDIPSDGYLTGFPLTQDGMYVLARTWAAPEMPRPGCIWTHSLLITFTGLAELKEPRQLLRFFRRPSSTPIFSDYSSPITLDGSPQQSWPRIDQALARHLLLEIYAEPLKKVIVEIQQTGPAESTLLAIWGQQWPRLRRNFRYCSLTSDDRSTRQHVFDVQFRLRGGIVASAASGQEDDTSDDWTELCVRDLDQPTSELRQFLKRAGSDITGGRMRFAELCSLFAEHQRVDEVKGIELTLQYVVNRLPVNEGRLLRTAAVADSVRMASRLGSESVLQLLPFVEDHLTNVDRSGKLKLAKRYWDIDPQILLGQGSAMILCEELDAVIESLDQDDAIAAVLREEDVAREVLPRRIDLLNRHEIWRSSAAEMATELLAEITNAQEMRPVVVALMTAERTDMVSVACRSFGAKVVFEASVSKDSSGSGSAVEFALHAFGLLVDKEKYEAVKAILERESIVDKRLIHAFVRTVSSDLPKLGSDGEKDPWVALWNRAVGDIGPGKVDSIILFFLIRAITVSESHAASLLEMSYDHVLDRYHSGRFGFEKRSRLTGYLLLSDWFDWSFESRLTRTVAELAVDRRFTAEEFQALSRKKCRFARVLRSVESFEGGSKYLDGIQVHR